MPHPLYNDCILWDLYSNRDIGRLGGVYHNSMLWNLGEKLGGT